MLAYPFKVKTKSKLSEERKVKGEKRVPIVNYSLFIIHYSLFIIHSSLLRQLKIQNLKLKICAKRYFKLPKGGALLRSYAH